MRASMDQELGTYCWILISLTDIQTDISLTYLRSPDFGGPMLHETPLQKPYELPNSIDQQKGI